MYSKNYFIIFSIRKLDIASILLAFLKIRAKLFIK
jgi:hypothetical protein